MVRALWFVVAALVLAVAFFLGLVVLAVIAGVIIIGGFVLAARVAWVKRKLRAGGAAPVGEQPRSIIEGEFQVVRRDQSDEQSCDH